MPKPDLIKDRDKRTAKRKLKKEKFDSMFSLAADTDANSIRLLDEGMVTYGDGSPYFYIKKGTLANLVENMRDDYVGSINLGHMDFARFPFILGTWKKKDIKLVDIGNGRKGLDVTPHFDNDSMFIKEMKRLPYDLAVSAQFSAHMDLAATEEYGVEIIDEIYPKDFNFAIVGEPGNVNSAGLRLAVKGETMTLEELSAAIEQNPTDLDGLNALLSDETAETSVEAAVETPAEEPDEEKVEAAVEETVEETAEVPAEPVETSVEPQEEPETVEVEESTAEAEEAAEEAPDALTEALNAIEAANARITELEAQVESLTAQLAAKKKSEQEFLGKFKNLSVALTKVKETKKTEPAKPAYSDGFGA